MGLAIGSVHQGKVTGITKFGAFVQLPEGGSGLVHISEIAYAFVNDVNDYLSVGDEVTVKVIGVNEAGKINLSIKQVQPPASKPAPAPRPASGGYSRGTKSYASLRPASAAKSAPVDQGEVRGPSDDASFEDKLKHFMQESDSKVSGNKLYADKRGGRRRK